MASPVRPATPALVGITLVSGVAVGAAGRATDHVDTSLLHWAGTLGGPWLVAAFALGTVAGGRRRGAAAGAAALAVGVLTYYALFALVEHRASGPYALVVGTAWVLGALPVGAAFGWAGAAWRRGRGPRWAAVLAGALVGEALLLWVQGRVLGGTWRREDAVTALQVQAVVGIVAALVLTRARLRTLVWTGGVALAVVVAEATLRGTLRATGWAGA